MGGGVFSYRNKKRCKSLSINELRAAAGPFAVTHYRSVTYEDFFLIKNIKIGLC